MDAEQTKLKWEEGALLSTREEIQKAKSEIQAEMGERIKEFRTEIEQDRITPLKNKMTIVDEKVDGLDKKTDALGAGMKLLLERNETAAAPTPAFKARPRLPPAGQLPFYKPRQANNGFANRRPVGGRGATDMVCFKCGQKGHGFRNCPLMNIAACVEVGRAVNEFDEEDQCVECSTEELYKDFEPDGKLDDGTGHVVCYLAQDLIRPTISKL